MAVKRFAESKAKEREQCALNIQHLWMSIWSMTCYGANDAVLCADSQWASGFLCFSVSGSALWWCLRLCWNPLCYHEHHYRVWMLIVHSEMCWLLCLGWQEIAWLFFCCTCYLSTTCLFSWCQQMHLICVIIGKEGSLDILEDISIQNFFA